MGGLICFFPQRELGRWEPPPRARRRPSKRAVTATLLTLLLMILTVFAGVAWLDNRKYYFISLLLLLETFLPFCMMFEGRRPAARELILISVLAALAVAGRTAFFMLPQFKPVVALVILSGVCFGGETGFLVGAVTGFVSNIFSGQGPWTPWQMFAFGSIGLLAGALFYRGALRWTRASLCLFGGAAALLLYGGIMNPASVLLWQDMPTWQMIAAAYLAGLPFDLIHAVSTMVFLWFLAEPMIEKLNRVQTKYGLFLQ